MSQPRRNLGSEDCDLAGNRAPAGSSFPEIVETTPVDSPDSANSSELVEKTSAAADQLPFTSELSKWFEAQSWVEDASAHAFAVSTVLVGLILACLLVFFTMRPVTRWIGRRVLAKGGFAWNRQFRSQRVYFWVAHFAPGFLILALSPLLFAATSPAIARFLETAAEIYLISTGYFLILALLRAMEMILSRRKHDRSRNVKLVAQMARVLATLVVFILYLVALLHKPPLLVLSGLGVFASVIMLIFKDVILGFAAGLQLSLNRMLAIGDWLEMPSKGADGTVEEIGITTTKVRNWDQTITTIPTYALIGESFRNWRGMSESGGRRIKRPLLVDTNSIRFCDEAMIKRFRRIPQLADVLEAIDHGTKNGSERPDDAAGTEPLIRKQVTNVGMFRAYLEAWLREHPQVKQDMLLMVRQLEPSGRGLPLEVYCFSANQEWVAYEKIQADLFDHFFAIAPEFDLRIFQEPTGHDLEKINKGDSATQAGLGGSTSKD